MAKKWTAILSRCCACPVALLVLAGAAQTQVFAATITVSAGDNLQVAIDTAHPGDTILLQAGATFIGNYVLPNKGSGTEFIVITSTGVVPAPGVRVDPAIHAAAMPKIMSASVEPALQTAFGAHHYRFVGIEIGTNHTSRSTTHYNVLLFGYDLHNNSATTVAELPSNIVIERCYIHGTPQGNVRRGLAFNVIAGTISDSYLSEFHEVGADSQAVGAWNTPGPIAITNNYIQAAGENIMFGGAVPTIPNLVPSDITVHGNYFTKSVTWKIDDPAFGGIPWSVKNIFELKNAQRVKITGNVFEHSWPHAQAGYAIVLTTRTEDGAAPWARVSDIAFRDNIVRYAKMGFLISAHDDNGMGSGANYDISNNLFYEMGGRWGGVGRLAVIVNSPSNLTFNHNTLDGDVDRVLTMGNFTPSPQQVAGFTFTNNMMKQGEYGIIGDGTGPGAGTIATYFPGSTIAGNVLAGRDVASTYPAANHFPSDTAFDAGFVERSTGNYRLVASSPYRGAGTDSADIGVNMNQLLGSATSGSQPRVRPIAPTNVRIVGD